MGKVGMTVTVLATGLAEAYQKDEQFAKDNPTHKHAGFDISAGMFGVEVSKWLREIAKDIAD